jgi:enamine deaminase RidA (YjgF/YER057c/UK114 family)
VVHAQVYLTDRDDYSAFNEAWTRHFAKSPPTLDIIPCIEHGLAPYDGKIEINVLALKPGGAAKRRAIDAGVPTAFRHQPQAMKAGDLLFMSGLMAFDGHGLAASTATDPRQPQFSSSAEAQAEFIISNIAKLCEAAGTSLSNVVRVLQFHTDIREFYADLQGLGAPPRRPSSAVLGGRGACAAAGAGRDRADRGLGLMRREAHRHSGNRSGRSGSAGALGHLQADA